MPMPTWLASWPTTLPHSRSRLSRSSTRPASPRARPDIPKTIDEESSGIIDVAELMGPGTFLFDAQIHTSAGLTDPTRQVEHGQLLKMTVDWDSVF